MRFRIRLFISISWEHCTHKWILISKEKNILGFTDGGNRSVSPGGGLLDVCPQFSHNTKSKSFNSGSKSSPNSGMPSNDHHSSFVLKTRKLLEHSSSVLQSPSQSLGLNKVGFLNSFDDFHIKSKRYTFRDLLKSTKVVNWMTITMVQKERHPVEMCLCWVFSRSFTWSNTILFLLQMKWT